MTMTYCSLVNIQKDFSVYYPYVSLVICIFGSVTNVLNICVLTNKQLRCPTNMILTAFAFANLIVMIEYIPFVFLYTEKNENVSHFTYAVAVFIIFHAFFTQALHFISCCLTVVLAIWQYISVKFPHHNNKWCNVTRTKIAVFLTYLLCPIVCIPLNLSLTIKEFEVPVDRNGKIYKNNQSLPNQTIYLTDYVDENYLYISSYVYAIAIKLIPCVLLTVLITLLIIELIRAKKRRQNLLESKNEETKRFRKPSQRFLDNEKQTDRTTKMLIVVLVLFLMVEFPQAILGLLNVVLGKDFEKQCYQTLGDIVDVLTLTNFAVNFILYCIMSKKFRTVFKNSFFQFIPCSKIAKQNWISLNTIHTYL